MKQVRQHLRCSDRVLRGPVLLYKQEPHPLILPLTVSPNSEQACSTSGAARGTSRNVRSCKTLHTVGNTFGLRSGDLPRPSTGVSNWPPGVCGLVNDISRMAARPSTMSLWVGSMLGWPMLFMVPKTKALVTDRHSLLPDLCQVRSADRGYGPGNLVALRIGSDRMHGHKKTEQKFLKSRAAFCDVQIEANGPTELLGRRWRYGSTLWLQKFKAQAQEKVMCASVLIQVIYEYRS